MRTVTVRNLRAYFARLRARGPVVFGRDPRFGSGVTLDARKGGRIEIGDNVKILRGSILDARYGSIQIGNDCSVNPYSVIYGYGRGVEIGNFVRIGAHVAIIPVNHGTSDRTVPIHLQRQSSKGIIIGNDVWIGAHCTVLDGSRISDGCVLAAGAVLTRDTEPFGIYAGVPARLIKHR
jgi:acetyltransferase-like isoleucine patch superfamily enzyme